MTLSAGARDGVAATSEVHVIRPGHELRHPRTGALLGRTEERIGRVAIDDISPTSTRGRLLWDRGVQVGDRLQIVITLEKPTLFVVPFVEAGDGRAAATFEELLDRLRATNVFALATLTPPLPSAPSPITSSSCTLRRFTTGPIWTLDSSR